MAGDDVTAFLDDVQAQAEDHHLVPGAMALPLVAALRKVLKEAGDFEANRPERLVTRRYAAECFRAAISRELTGKGEPGA